MTPKVRKPELSFLYATHRLVLFYISTKYHKNIQKGIRLTEDYHNIPKGICITEQTQNLFQTK